MKTDPVNIIGARPYAAVREACHRLKDYGERALGAQTRQAFFEMFEKARGNLTLPQEVAVLNAVARGEFTSARGTGTATCLMRWFEVFRDIYIANRVVREREERAPGKNPDAFTTFARTFEPLAMLPDFWFANEELVKGKHVRDLAHPVRLAFERYMYSCAGGGVWGAMDWEMWRYVQMRIFEPLRSGPAVLGLPKFCPF